MGYLPMGHDDNDDSINLNIITIRYSIHTVYMDFQEKD